MLQDFKVHYIAKSVFPDILSGGFSVYDPLVQFSNGAVFCANSLYGEDATMFRDAGYIQLNGYVWYMLRGVQWRR